MTLSFTLAEIDDAAEKLFEFGKAHKVWAIYGEMGAGKTTLVHAVCEALGLISTFGSPTYSIINEYKVQREGIVYHMDWYRLKDEEEAMQAGVEDCLFSGSRCFIEWPEKAPALLPDDCLHVLLTVAGQNTRKISIK